MSSVSQTQAKLAHSRAVVIELKKDALSALLLRSPRCGYAWRLGLRFTSRPRSGSVTSTTTRLPNHTCNQEDSEVTHCADLRVGAAFEVAWVRVCMVVALRITTRPRSGSAQALLCVYTGKRAFEGSP